MSMTPITIPQGTFYASPTEDSKVYFGLTKLGVFYDAQFSETIKSYLPEQATVVDIGANLGQFSVAVADKAFKVYAFEPVERSRLLLQKNVASYRNIEVIGCALGDRSENSGTYKVSGQGSISLKRLDSFDLNPDFIKIDVQGLEIRVLEGARQTIKMSSPVILFEVSNLTMEFGGLASLRRILKGYKLELFPDHKLVNLLRLWLELYVRYLFNRPKGYDVLAIKIS